MINGASFYLDGWATFFLLLAMGVFYLCRRLISRCFSKHFHSTAFFSHTGVLKKHLPLNMKRRLAIISPYFLAIAALLASLAIVDPILYWPKSSLNQEALSGSQNQEKMQLEKIPVEGLGMYLLLDISGSMKQVVGQKGKKTLTRLEVLKELTEHFLSGEGLKGFSKRSHDMIGLMTFARVAELRFPLTLDRQGLIEEVKNLQVVDHLEKDGTAIAYALHKAINYLKATQELAKQLEGKKTYALKGNVVILITDGFNYPSPLDQDHPRRQISLQQVAGLAKESGVHLYIINVDPQLNQPAYAKQLRELREVSSLSSGQFYLLKNPLELEKVYEDIEKREKETYHLTVEKTSSTSKKVNEDFQWDDYQKLVLFPYFVYGSLGLLACYVLMEALWFRRVR